MPDQRNKLDRYATISDEELCECVKALEDEFLRFCDIYKLSSDAKCHEDQMALAEIVRRVDKRKAYFSYFHKGMIINELKETALYAYWILKFRPFTLVDERYNDTRRALRQRT